MPTLPSISTWMSNKHFKLTHSKPTACSSTFSVNGNSIFFCNQGSKSYSIVDSSFSNIQLILSALCARYFLSPTTLYFHSYKYSSSHHFLTERPQQYFSLFSIKAAKMIFYNINQIMLCLSSKSSTVFQSLAQ